MSATMVKSNNGAPFPTSLFVLSLAIYLATLIITVFEYDKEDKIHTSLCGRYKENCWSFLYVTWIIVLTFCAFSIIASIILRLMHKHDYPHKNSASIRTLVLIAAMWLTVIVVGWWPLSISVTAGHNGLPDYSSEWPSYKSKDATPLAGMFHYAVAWYQNAVVNTPSPAQDS